jgi:uncharacterized repeat protein (TIGR01451 family)
MVIRGAPWEHRRRGWRDQKLIKSRATQLVAAGFSAAAVLMFAVPLAAQAAPLTPATAEGDSYAAQAIAKIAVLPTVTLGPLASSYATVPPGVTVGSQSGTLVVGPNAPLPPVLTALNVTNDTSKATLAPVATTDCQPNQVVQDGNTGPMSGGNACSTIASVEAINIGTVQVPLPQVTADAIFTQSITQQCDPSQGLPTGKTVIAHLALGGVPIVIPSGGFAPNTTLSVPGVLKVILNEQKLENVSGGQGLTVNAIHIITDPAISQLLVADVIVGHVHSNATCTTPPAQQPCAVAGISDPRCHGEVITKTDNTGTETAKPGQTITYTLNLTPVTIDVPCRVNLVTDTLPPGFTFVSSTGALGSPTSVVGQVVTWFNAAGFTPPLIETIVAKIAANEPDGFFSNQVETLSSGGPGCGDNAGSSPPIHNIVTPAPPNNGGGNAGAGQSLPGTSTDPPEGSPWSAVIILGVAMMTYAAIGMVRALRVR